jgi:hypothetical protein
LAASVWPFFIVPILGYWIGFLIAAIYPANTPLIILAPGGVAVGMAVSKVWGIDVGQLGPALANSAIYGLAMYAGRRLYRAGIRDYSASQNRNTR